MTRNASSDSPALIRRRSHGLELPWCVVALLLSFSLASAFAAPNPHEPSDECQADRVCWQHEEAARNFSVRGDYAEALVELEAAYQIASSAHVCLNLGRVLFHLGRYEEAMRYYNEARELAESLEPYGRRNLLRDLVKYLQEAEQAQRRSAARRAQALAAPEATAVPAAPPYPSSPAVTPAAAKRLALKDKPTDADVHPHTVASTSPPVPAAPMGEGSRAPMGALSLMLPTPALGAGSTTASPSPGIALYLSPPAPAPAIRESSRWLQVSIAVVVGGGLAALTTALVFCTQKPCSSNLQEVKFQRISQ